MDFLPVFTPGKDMAKPTIDSGVPSGAAPGSVCIESPKHLATDFLRHQKCFARNDVAVVVAPRLDLHLDAGLQLVMSRTRADQDHR